ncbi:hypothetical protein [Agromyces sp. M3QZ16-3]|uniref:hypothetical protein n=1 Tax=Agromyces sp. M3QZ16-3 TaxID=3447585 RepID=UPI003F68C604
MPTVAQTSDLRITLPDVARLANVKRPVVSVWRKRFATGPHPFPRPIDSAGRTEVFDASEIVRWLTDTAHGNNSSAATEVSLFARPAGFDDSYCDAVTSLLGLRASRGAPLATFDAAALVDAADEADPDDELLFREIEALGSDAERMARHVDDLVEAAYGVGPAFEHVLDSHRRSRRDAAPGELASAAASLFSELAIELALTNPSADATAPEFADPSGVCADRLVEIADRLTDVAEPIMRSADRDTAAARLLRRRLLAHGVPRTAMEVDEAGGFEASGPVVHVAQYPSPEATNPAPSDILASIDQIAVQMDDSQRAVVLGPASVLVDGGLDAEAAAARSALLRTGRVRAIVRLPAGLLQSAPRQHLALWVLGPAHERVAIAERWTMLSDLSAFDLSPTVRGDLVGDLAAAMGDRDSLRAHGFTFTRIVLTSRVLARSGSLLDDGASLKHAPERSRADAEASARLDALTADLGGDTVPASIRRFASAKETARVPAATLGELARDRHVRYVAGSRLDEADITADSGFAVIGPDEVRGLRTPGERRVDRLQFAATYPSGRLTEPGDVVFVTANAPTAWVDHEGASVVMAPARVLRINRNDDAGLVPDILATDIARSAPGTPWRTWVARRVATDQRAPVAEAIADLRRTRTELRARLAKLDELEHLIVAGTTAGTLKITEPEGDMHAPED